MKAITIVVAVDDERKFDVRLGSSVLGGKVVAVAAYDAIHTSTLAEDALAECGCGKCRDAYGKIMVATTGDYIPGSWGYENLVKL